MCLALLLVVTGCTALADRAVVPLVLDPAVPLSLPDGADNPRVLSRVAGVLVTRLGLPLSGNLRAYFYTSQAAFELGLVNDARVETWLARDHARFAWGVGTYDGIFLREDKLAGASLLARVGLIAHELTHVSQYGLAGGRRGSSDQWLREGFADWVRFQVLEYFSLRAYSESRRRVLGEVGRVGSVETFPRLTALVTNREWVTARNQLGQVATYGQAFLAADWLVERRGSEAVSDYFRRFGRLDDRKGNFIAAFGMRVEQFAEEFRARLSALVEMPGRPLAVQSG